MSTPQSWVPVIDTLRQLPIYRWSLSKIQSRMRVPSSRIAQTDRMVPARLLDVLLVLAVLVFIGEGWRNGVLRSASGTLGIVAGGAIAFFAIPLIAAIVPDPF